jgi:hypothetical protein
MDGGGSSAEAGSDNRDGFHGWGVLYGFLILSMA